MSPVHTVIDLWLKIFCRSFLILVRGLYKLYSQFFPLTMAAQWANQIEKAHSLQNHHFGDKSFVSNIFSEPTMPSTTSVLLTHTAFAASVMFIRTVLKEVQTMTHNLILPHKLQGIAIYLEAFLEMICLCWLSSPTNAIDSSAMKSTRPLKST